MISTGDTGNGENNEAESGPDEPRNLDAPWADVLHAESKRVDIGNRDGDGAEDEDELNELSKSVDGRVVSGERSIHETAGASSIESISERGISGDCGREGGTKGHDEDLSGDQRKVSPAEQHNGASVVLHVDRIVSAEGAPCNGVAETRCHETHPICHLGLAASRDGEILIISTSKTSEDNERRVHDHPRVTFVQMNVLISEETDDKRAESH